MKKAIATFLSLALTLSLLLTGCGGGGDAGTNTPSSSANPGDGTEVQDVQLKVWVPEEEMSIMRQMAESFNEAHPEYNFSVDLTVVDISDVDNKLKTDVDSAADVFQISSSRVPELQPMGLLLPIGYEEEALRSMYPETAITSVSGSDGLLYAVPFTPNTYFMYYNKSMFTEEEIQSLETMLAKDLGDGVEYNVSFPITNNWYIEAFFYAAGCSVFGPDGTDPTSCDWNSANGLAAGQYLIDLVNNPKFTDDKDGYGLGLLREGKVGTVFTGTWDAAKVEEALGENYAAAKLPTININGADSQLHNWGDYKTYAVKSSTAYPLAAQQFAEWICNEENQMIRYEDQGVSPCITSLANDPALASDPASAALIAQAEHYYAQPSISEIESYWPAAEALGQGIVYGEITSDNLQAQLDNFVTSITSGSLAG